MDSLLIRSYGLDQSNLKQANFLNLDLRISGMMFETYDIMEIWSINITYEFDYSTGGYFIL